MTPAGPALTDASGPAYWRGYVAGLADARVLLMRHSFAVAGRPGRPRPGWTEAQVAALSDAVDQLAAWVVEEGGAHGVLTPWEDRKARDLLEGWAGWHCARCGAELLTVPSARGPGDVLRCDDCERNGTDGGAR